MSVYYPRLPCVLLKMGSPVTTVSGNTILVWNTEEYDPLDMFTAGGTNITVKVPGVYLLCAQVLFDSVSSGSYRQVTFYLNGSPVSTEIQRGGNTPDFSNLTTHTAILKLAKDDVVTVYGNENATGSIILGTGSAFQMVMLSKG